MSDVCPGCGVDSITPHIAGCPTVADRPLTTGSERLARAVWNETDADQVEIIKADPGIVALVELVQEMCSMAVSPSRDFWQSSAKIAIKKWETGQ